MNSEFCHLSTGLDHSSSHLKPKITALHVQPKEKPNPLPFSEAHSPVYSSSQCVCNGSSVGLSLGVHLTLASGKFLMQLGPLCLGRPARQTLTFKILYCAGAHCCLG